MALNEEYHSDASDLTEPEDAEEQHAFQQEQYYYVMGQKERMELMARAEKERLNAEREQQAEQRRYGRRREEEERLVTLGKRNILVLIWDGFDDMFTVTTVDILRSADVNVVVGNVTGCVRRRKPTLLARGANGVTLLADINFETTGNHNFHLFNGIVLPGGRGVQELCSHRKLISLIKTMSYKEKFVCGACEAVWSLFIAARVVIGRVVAAPTGVANSLKTAGAKDVVSSEPVIVDYNLVTARYRADVFEFGLIIVKCIFGEISEAQAAAAKYNYVSRVLDRLTQVEEEATEAPQPPEGEGEDAQQEEGGQDETQQQEQDEGDQPHHEEGEETAGDHVEGHGKGDDQEQQESGDGGQPEEEGGERAEADEIEEKEEGGHEAESN
eukprot:PhF_6_TR41585/c0_g1_i1/m.63015